MKKNIILLILALNTILLSKPLEKIPLNKNFLSQENGGNKSAIDAYSDGVGLYALGIETNKYEAMNKLVYDYGEESKNNETSLKDYVLENGNNKEQELANLLGEEIQETIIGAPCDDGNANTINDLYIDTNGTCKGEIVKSIVKCFGETIGTEFIVDGSSYLVVDNETIRDHLDRAETLCTSNVTDMSNLFRSSTFNGDLSKWDVSNVINMDSMFIYADFNGDLSNWETNKLESTYNMFDSSKFNNNSLKNWNVTNIYYFYEMFANSEFNGDLSNWDLTNAYNTERMFRNSKFNNNSIKNWNVGNVRNMNGMFSNTLFNQNISNWNVSNVLYYDDFAPNLEIVNTPLFIN